MKYLLSLSEVKAKQRRLVGGKGFSLAVLARHGFQVPATLIVTTRAYEDFVTATGLRGRILLELRRKKFADLRWEEIWDAALRLRNLFLTTPWPPDLVTTLSQELAPSLPDPCVLRSSAPGEDSPRASFAGLHASFVNISGLEAVLDHLKLVWASLWSDAALLYRRELGLAVRKSAMAVLIQEMVVGEKSGVAFGQHPQNPTQVVIEAVYGLNQGLVDGTVEPDRWLLDRTSGRVLAYQAAPKTDILVPGPTGVQLAPLPPDQAQKPPLSESEVAQIYQLIRRSEALFGRPQDLEWTFSQGRLIVLQSRPITTRREAGPGDQRPWYLSLKKSFATLSQLRQRVEEELLPAMADEAAALAAVPLAELSEKELLAEIKHRSNSYQHWKKVYWDDFIPLAHGVRLFGLVYNDAVRPKDPFEFLNLLGAADMLSLRRNQLLEAMAERLRVKPELATELRSGKVADPELRQLWETFLQEFGDLFCGAVLCAQAPAALTDLLQELTSRPPAPSRRPPLDPAALQEQFLARFAGPQREAMAAYLDLARASYRLRDDDNLYLGRIQAQWQRAVAEYRRRGGQESHLPAEAKSLLQELQAGAPGGPSSSPWPGFSRVKARQLVGQPASPGLARGLARVILDPADLFSFQAGEILICDAVDPSLTFVVPLAAGIVERRGGMLIHGSIIAREYGLPCVTGVPRATSLIHTGDTVTVDGYLGIVILG